MMMGLKREHKEILEKKIAQHEVDVFAVRGETVELLQKKYASRIEELEKEVETLRTLLSIQVRRRKHHLRPICDVLTPLPKGLIET